MFDVQRLTFNLHQSLLNAFAALLISCPFFLTSAMPVQAEGDDLSRALASVRQATRRFLEIEQAQREGYRQVTPMIRHHGIHLFNPSITEFDLMKPQLLLYVKQGETWQLVGVEYVAATPKPPSHFPGAPWHRHEASCHFADGTEEGAASAILCPQTHPRTGATFTAWHPPLWQLHVWAWHPNPSGLFAETNPWLALYGGTQGMPGGSREHATWNRSPAQIAFSEFNHNSAGFLLTLMGLFAVAEILVPGRRFTKSLWPLAAITLSLWVLARSDPQVWPLGPIPLLQGLRIPSVWQHKLLGLIMLTIGGVELLRRKGRLTHPAWDYLFPALAIIGGFLLIIHGAHASARHLLAFIAQQVVWGLQGFKIYLQHATMGVLALLIGGTKLLWDRNDVRSGGAGEQRKGKLIWRLLMIVFGLLLFFYQEA
ncbi:MAG: hypothetical protein ACK4Z6_04675 [Candidatus Methylomirabilales bacterium]